MLQDDTLGLAALRARLDAAGARHAELAGWDAEEPSAGTAVSARSALSGGPVDEVDLAAGTAVSTVDGVRGLRRAWEEFRGGAGGPVRVYVPVLGGPVDLVAVAGALSATVAAAGACCVVVPVPADPALADARQAAVAEAATEVWPHPCRGRAGGGRPEPPAPVVAAGGGASVAAPVVEAPVVGAGCRGAGCRGARSRMAPVTEEPAPLPASQPGDRPGDVPGAPFELIAANLQWEFDSGAEQDDAVDVALRAHAEQSPRTAALFRTWVHDPAGSWVRVLLGYVNRGSIADVESERTALVDILQKSGAARCCVEVLAATDVTDAHRWLEARCHPLWPIAPAPADGLPEDAQFRAGPPADDPEHGETLAALVDWASGRPGVVGLVTAYTGDDRLVVGVALDGETDPDEVRASAPAPVEPFAPARGLDPRAPAARAAPPPGSGPGRPTGPSPSRPARPAAPCSVPTCRPWSTRGRRRPGTPRTPAATSASTGFTLVGIDRDTAVGKGAPQPDQQDAALVAFATAEPGAIALLRGVTDDGLKVYCLAVEATVDPEAARRDLAGAAAARRPHPAPPLEAFAPAGAISAFHLDLAVGSTRLWPITS